MAHIMAPKMASKMASNTAHSTERPALPAAGVLTGQTATLSCLKLSNDGIGGKYTRSIWSSLSKHPGV